MIGTLIHTITLCPSNTDRSQYPIYCKSKASSFFVVSFPTSA